MTVQSLLARAGLRTGVLGSLGALAIAAPVSDGDLSQSAHTAANRTGVYFDQTASAEAIGFVVGGQTGPQLNRISGVVRITTVAPTTASAGFILPHGTTPTTPTDGALWTTTTGLFIRINGVTQGPLNTGNISGTIALGQIAVGTGPDTIGGSPGLTYTGGTLTAVGNVLQQGASGVQYEIQNASDANRGLRITATTGVGVRVATNDAAYPLILGVNGGSEVTINSDGTVLVGVADPGGSNLFRVGGFITTKGITSNRTGVLNNEFFGTGAGNATATGAGNTIVGSTNANALTTGANNVIVGFNNANLLQSGSNNYIIGQGAVAANVSGSNIIAIGLNALAAVTAGSNVAIGNLAGQILTSGNNNALFGLNTGANLTGQSFVTFIGNDAGERMQANNNTALGYQALRGSAVPASNTGTNNVAVGNLTANAITSGANNTIIGSQSGTGITSGSTNIMVGTLTGVGITTGTDNIFIGSNITPTGNISGTCIIGQANCLTYILGRADAHATPQNVTLSPTHATGTDIAGANLTIAGGYSTGTGVGGSIILRTAPAGGAGPGINALITRLTISGDGAVAWSGIATSSAPAVSAANNGRIYYDSTLQGFRVSRNGSFYTPLGGVVPPFALTDGATINTDASLSTLFTVTIAGNRNMAAPTNPSNGQRIMYRITQDGIGSRTIAWDADFVFSATLPAPTLSTTPGAVDYVGFIYSTASAKWHCLAYTLGF